MKNFRHLVFFGDKHLGSELRFDYSRQKEFLVQKTDGLVDEFNEWGARHYWYYWLCVILFILSVIRIAIWAIYYWEENKHNS